jgi:hypothetical protein
MQKIFTENVRQVLFTMIPFVFLGANSMYFATINRPEEFEKFGAVIAIWSIFNISRLRNSYSSSVADWDRTLLRKFVNFYKEKDALQDERLNITFNLHAAQIAQISSHLGMPNPFVEDDKEAIQAFCNDVREKLQNDGDFQSRHVAAHQQINSFVEDYTTGTMTVRSWEPLLWNIEIGLAIWGTLQNAYGADFVRLLHS